jgi:3-oxoadipate enol-lactonase
MPFANHNGVKIHWEEQGDGTPILLVMGHRYSGRMWYALLPALSETHRVIWFDNRGTGESDAPRDATMADLAGDARSVLDAAGVASAHVFGVSMGGPIIQELAMSTPDRVTSLALGCTGVLTADVPRAKKWMRVLYYVPFWVYAGSKKLREGSYGTATSPEAIALDMAMLKDDPFTPRGVIAQSKALATYSTTHEAVAAIGKPAIVLHGTLDHTVPYALGQDLANTIPGARLVTIEGAGHNFIVADPDLVSKELLAFWESVDHG